MKKIITLASWTFVLGSFFVFYSCSYLKELSALRDCEFRVGTMEKPLLAGVNISKIVTTKDYSIDQTAKITKSILKGILPLSFVLNVEVKNPNKKNASLNRLEYLAYIDDVQVAAGAMEEHVVIPPDGGIANIPLKVETDIFDLLKKEPINTLLNYALNLADDGDRPVRVSIKIKPWMQIGNKDRVYPGYLTINQDFSSGE